MLATYHHRAVETNSLVVPMSFSNSLVVLNAIAARLSNIAFSHKPIGQPDFALLLHTYKGLYVVCFAAQEQRFRATE